MCIRDRISGFVTSSGVTSVSVGTGLDGGGSSSSVTVSLDLSELADMTQSWTSSDEFIVLDAGVQKRKQSSEIFGSNAFNSTTIPTNTNQLTNGANFASLSEIDDAIEAYGGSMNNLQGASNLFGGGSSGVTNQGLSRDVAYKIMTNTNSSVACVTTTGGSSEYYLRYKNGGNFSWERIAWNHIEGMSTLDPLP